MSRRRTLGFVTTIGVILIVVVEITKGYLTGRLGFTEGLLMRIEVGSVVTLLLIVLNLTFHFSAAQADEVVSIVGEQLRSFRTATGSISVLTSVQLYSELVRAAQTARHRVYNTYLGAVPPLDSNLPAKQDYFGVILKLVKQKREVTFRRVVLLTDANKTWIRELVRQYAGSINVSLAVYTRPDRATHPLSVQLFDDGTAFIVHAAARPPGQPRDILITDNAVASLLDDYYEELWCRSDVVLDCGRPDNEKMALLA